MMSLYVSRLEFDFCIFRSVSDFGFRIYLSFGVCYLEFGISNRGVHCG